MEAGDGKQQFRLPSRPPVELRVDHQETAVVPGDARRQLAEERCAYAFAHLAARKVLRELDRDKEALLVADYVEGLCVEQDAVPIGKRLAPEVSIWMIFLLPVSMR